MFLSVRRHLAISNRCRIDSSRLIHTLRRSDDDKCQTSLAYSRWLTSEFAQYTVSSEVSFVIQHCDEFIEYKVLVMLDSIPIGLIDHLIEIGRQEAFEDLEQIGMVFPAASQGAFMRLCSNPWDQIAQDLSEESLICLIKSLTVLEQQSNFKAGSVAPVIWLYRHVPNGRERIDLIDWILSHTKNDYLPFGSSNHGAKSFEELRLLSEQVAHRTQARQDSEIERRRDAKARKQKEASQRLFGAIRRRDIKAIDSLLARGADCNVVNELGQTAFQCAESSGLGHLFAAASDKSAK